MSDDRRAPAPSSSPVVGALSWVLLALPVLLAVAAWHLLRWAVVLTWRALRWTWRACVVLVLLAVRLVGSWRTRRQARRVVQAAEAVTAEATS